MFNSKFSYGVLKHPGYNGKQDAPPAPDTVGAAKETAAGNLEAARTATAANRVNQVTPYGNLTYNINGKDSYGNDLYTATQTLTPAQQKILEQNQGLSSGLLNTAQQGLDYASGLMSKPGVDMSKLPSYGINPGETYSDAIMRRLAPQIAQENEMSDAALANQGIAQGTEAYNNAKRTLQMGQNDRQVSAITGGMGVGLQANNQAFNQEGYNQMQPINVINALRTGSQVQAPNFVSVPGQSTTAGPDILGATNADYANKLSGVNANNAASGGFLGGLMNLGGTLGSAAIKYSDRRLKTNIEKIGEMANGLALYAYDYIWGEHDIGVMADEVEKVMPEAVITMPNGFKAVNYSMLGA